MSRYKVIQTEFRSLQSLQAALVDVLRNPSAFQVAPSPKTPSLQLYDWHGQSRPEHASIRIPRQAVNRFSSGSSNDVGFAWNGKTFEAIVSEYDQDPQYGCTNMLNRVRQRYALHELRSQAKAKGYTLREHVHPDGSINLVLTHR